MDLELVSFKICPYVQRSIITLKQKDAPFKLTHLKMGDKPEWFQKISPLGQVPVLVVDGQTPLFESSVINEFVDEATPGALHPEDVIERARHRAWIAFCNDCMGDFSQMSMAPSQEGFESARDSLLKKLARLEDAVSDGPLFAGQAFSLVDSSYAPMFMRLTLLEGWIADFSPFANLPKTAAWRDALLALPAVTESVVAEFPKLYRGFLVMRKGWLGQTYLATKS
ncbi:glutathione S-transferase family protein [Magnetofaba australis]|uniref:Putative glutathione S-transferase n=1 Tax=Magnetofaba australis IT-1 TaxID=1434232 RepID=A0A1Y2K6K1_9PROT|nr:glutathione S-transferase family protein [Magnetofaba australis]OSM04927.1 putative glutathione S-transferase [Magnetofaba australis IT-1]